MHAISLHLVLHAFEGTLMWCELNFNSSKPNGAWGKWRWGGPHTNTKYVSWGKKSLAYCIPCLLLELGLGAVPFEGGLWYGFLARPEARYDTKYFGSCWHDTNTRVVSCPESQHGGLHGLTRILSWHGTKIARRHFYNYTIQFFFSIYYTTSYLILE
jgi:hypothetical protein